MAHLEISILALGRPDTSASRYVAEAIKVAKRHGVRYEITAMGTTLEGEIDQLFLVAREMHEAPFALGIERVYSVLKIDDRRDRHSTFASKLQSVHQRL